MDFLRNQIARIQQQLNGLSASQKMLAGALVVIMMMTLYGWSLYASRSEMEPLLSQSLTDEESMEIRKHLASSGIKYQMVGGIIEVSAEQKYDAMALLGYAQVLPRDTKSAFDDFVSKSSIFQPKSMTDTLLNQARQQELARVLRCFPRVRQATVIVDPTRERGINKTEPSATVYLNLRSGEKPDQRLVDAAADLVSGAVANLARQRVKVIIDSVSYRVRGGDDQASSALDSASAWMDSAKQYEQQVRDKLCRHFSFINDVQIDVTAKPNLERTEKVIHKVDPKEKVQLATSEQTGSEDNSNSPSAAGDPGVMANAPMQVEPAAGGEKTASTSETSKSEYMSDFSKTDTRSVNPGGEMQVVGVSMYVPRSYFIQVFKKQSGGSAGDPDEATLKPFVAAELARLKTGVKTCLALATDDMVSVDSFTDLGPASGAAPQAATAASIPLAMTDHMKEIALGVLALVSLFMVSSMVRKGTPAPVVEAPPPPKPSQLGGREEAVGEASEGGAMLDGMELDEDSVKAQHMLSQVETLVGENPDAAAAMVKRWLNH